MKEEKGQNKLKKMPDNNRLALIWALLLLFFVGSIWLALGFNLTPFAIIAVLVGLALAYRYTYFFFYTAIFLLPFLGATISIPTGSLRLGERAFGGSIDLFLGEFVLLFVLGACALKVFFLWYKRRDIGWKPQFPLIKPYFGLLLAHAVSIFSSYQPDPILVLKFLLRPVAFCYMGFVALPANLIRSKRRLKAALGIMAVVGTIAAANGLISLATISTPGSSVRRAQPIAVFGTNPIGDNHNVLAELLLAIGPLTLALAALARKKSTRRVLYALAAIQTLVGLLTFARTAWIVAFVQMAFLLATVWHSTVKKHLAALIALVLLLSPLALLQIQFSFSPTAQSSNSTRWMLTDIAYQAFLEHPIIGSGAGTFLWRVGSARIFYQEFGDPLDAHGYIQKLMVETGSLGLLAYVILLIAGVLFVRRYLDGLDGNSRLAGYALAAAGGGAISYQFLNTAYWSAHMWLPIGLMLAGLTVLKMEDQN
ncbi:MAG: O-antigen ligase family protein [Patescibacteria group bacterium]